MTTKDDLRLDSRQTATGICQQPVTTTIRHYRATKY